MQGRKKEQSELGKWIHQVNNHVSVLSMTLALLRKKGELKLRPETLESLFLHCEQVVELNRVIAKSILEKEMIE
jgi:hypothetical protein